MRSIGISLGILLGSTYLRRIGDAIVPGTSRPEITRMSGDRDPVVPQSFHQRVAADAFNPALHPVGDPLMPSCAIFTHKAVKDGRWSDPTVWDTGTVPGANATVCSGAFNIIYDLLSDVLIKDIHINGAGGGEGAMDAANILKPALARGELRAIGATTLNEYQKYFEKDKALERRFQKVMIDEPTVEDAISILRGLKDRYETHHHVRIKDEAIIAAVELSNRYVTDRFLPDKAIDLIDESAAKLRLEMNSMPEELDKLERQCYNMA